MQKYSTDFKKQETHWRDTSKSVSNYEGVASEIKQELFKVLMILFLIFSSLVF